MGRVRAATLSLLAAGSVVGLTACAAIWGFQDAVDIGDASVVQPDGNGNTDGTVDTGASPEAGDDAASEAADANGTDGATGPDGGGGDGAADADAGDGHSSADAPPEAAGDGSPPDAGPCTAACVPAAPAGWEGPLQIYEGTGGPPPPTPPACAGAYPNKVYDGNSSPVAPAATCTCTCGAPAGSTCDPPVVAYFSDGACTQACGTPSQAIATTCTTLGTTGCSGTHVRIASPAPSGGSCTPDAGTAVPPAGWSGVARLCAPATAPGPSGCDAGQVCAPTTGLPFENATYCVARTGTFACPPGYPALRMYYGAGTDTRGCTPCTCGGPTGEACAGDVLTFYGGSNCNGTSTQFTAPQTCAPLGGSKVGISAAVAPTGGSCAPSDAGPTGAFTPTTPTTVCCTQ